MVKNKHSQSPEQPDLFEGPGTHVLHLLSPPEVIREDDTENFGFLDNFKLLPIANPVYWRELEGFSEVEAHDLGFLFIDGHEVTVSEDLEVVEFFLKLVGLTVKSKTSVLMKIKRARSTRDI